MDLLCFFCNEFLIKNLITSHKTVGFSRMVQDTVHSSLSFFLLLHLHKHAAHTTHIRVLRFCAQYILLKYHVHTCCIQYSHMYCTHTHTHIYIYHTPANHTHSNIIYTCHAHPKHIQTIMCTLHIHTRTYTLKHTQTHYLTLFMHMYTYTHPHTAPADLIRLILPNTLRPRHVPQVLSHHPLRDPVKQCPLCPHATI